MGANKSTPYYDPTLNAQLFDETKECKFYRNQQGQQFEKFKVKNKGNNDFENRYQYRIKNISPYLVDAYSSEAANNAFGCASADQYNVITERIPTRLCDLNNLTGREALNMVNKSLKGFQQIYKSQGVLLVKDTMIGLNMHNNVKVWMNSNFALNEVQTQPISYGVLSDSQKQSTMVDNIVQLINSRTKRDTQWTEFVEQKHRKGRLGFQQVIKITQIQCSKYNIFLSENDNVHMPPLIQSISQSSAKVNGQHISSTVNPIIINHNEQSILKKTNQTAVVSVNNPLNIHPNHIEPHFFNNLNVQNRPQNQSSGISSVKSKAMNGSFITNNNINKVNINQNISNGQRNISAQPVHTNLNYRFGQQRKNITNPPPNPKQFNIPNNPSTPLSITPNLNIKQVKPPNFNQNYNTYQSQQHLSPRPQSLGKPIVSFGNKIINDNKSKTIEPTNIFIPDINQKNKTFNNQTHVINTIQTMTQQKNYNNFNPQVFITNGASPQPKNNKIQGKIIQQVTNVAVPQQIHFRQQTIQKKQQNIPQIIQNRQQIQQIPNQNIQKLNNQESKNVGNVINTNNNNQNPNIVYPHPYKIVNFQKKVQITQSKYLFNPQNESVIVSQIQYKNLPNISQSINEQRSFQNGNTIQNAKQQLIQQNSSFIHKQNIQNQHNIPNQISYQFKVGASILKNNINQPQNNNFIVKSQQESTKANNKNSKQYQTNQKQKIQIFGQNTPYFRRERLENSQNIYSQHNEDQMLAHQQQQLKFLKQSKQESKSKKFQLNQNKNIITIVNKTQSNSQQNNIQTDLNSTQKINKNMINSQNKKNITINLKTQDLKDQKLFKKAVEQTASNIRMQTSKIAIRSSSDLKGIISYKDLRDLLKTTKKSVS